ncbi:zf-BED-domain-containing protein [Rhizophagus irregularis]|nr:zf-BED-domain-containing protein [Rhizophagus irregularis]
MKGYDSYESLFKPFLVIEYDIYLRWCIIKTILYRYLSTILYNIGRYISYSISFNRKILESATSSSANETISEGLSSHSNDMIVSDTELRELVRQGLIVDEVHEVLSYDRKNMPWIDNFINLLIKLKNQCDDPKEKAYHCLMREVFNAKVFHEASIQAGHIFKAEYLRNKIDDHIVDFIIQIGEVLQLPNLYVNQFKMTENLSSGSSSRTTSTVWSHFMLVKESTKAQCNYCDAKYKRASGNTTNLYKHLQRKHPSKVEHEAESTGEMDKFVTKEIPSFKLYIYTIFNDK